MNTTFDQSMRTGVEQYHQPRNESDVDLVITVREILNNAGLGHKVTEAFDTHHFIVEANGKASQVQRHLLNRYWNLQLMTVPTKSVEQRYCLIPNGEIKDWVSLFQKSVLPFIVEHNLPVRF